MGWSSLNPRRRYARALFVWLGFIVACGQALAARDDERITLLNEKIKTQESLVNAAKNENEKTRLDTQLQRLKKELGILVERQTIEDRKKALTRNLGSSPLVTLREKLRGIDRTVQEGEARQQDIANRRKRAVAERESLTAQIESLSGISRATLERKLELEEALFTRNEELRALALESEAVESEMELAREADRLRGLMKVIDTNARPSLRALFESYTRLRDEKKTDDRLNAVAQNLEQDLKISQGSLELDQQKLAKFDEELALLEKQAGFFGTDPQVARLLSSQRGQKKTTSERLPFLAAQVDAIKNNQQAVRGRQELIAVETTFLQDQLELLKNAYYQRLRWPAFALCGLGLIYLLTVYLVLPPFYKNESLFLARRLTRYVHVLVAAGLIAGFLFDDLSMVAGTMGIVSAALVISLQDVCTSVFGWFVIMLGEKFNIGDRLEVDGTRGDVLDIELLRTTMLEVNGWVGTDEPTGRVITIPNNFIFKTKVFNFTHGHPYIWAKMDLTVNAATPVSTAIALFERVLEEETQEQFAAARAAASTMHRRYGVEDAVYKPKINVQIVDTGVMLSLIYVSHYRHVAATRNQINRRLVVELEKHPSIGLSCPTLQILHDNLVSGAPSAVYGANGMGATASHSSRIVVPTPTTLRPELEVKLRSPSGSEN